MTSNGNDSTGSVFSQWLLNIGFLTALVLAAGSLGLGALYLHSYLTSTNQAVGELIKDARAQSEVIFQVSMNARIIMARLALISCTVFVGMAFGFLGFALFLLGVKGEMDVGAESESYRVKLARITPGVFVILIAAILIAFASAKHPTFEYTVQTAPPQTNIALRPRLNPVTLQPHDTNPPTKKTE